MLQKRLGRTRVKEIQLISYISLISHQTVSRLLSSPNIQSGKYNEMDPILISTAVSKSPPSPCLSLSLPPLSLPPPLSLSLSPKCFEILLNYLWSLDCWTTSNNITAELPLITGLLNYLWSLDCWTTSNNITVELPLITGLLNYLWSLDCWTTSDHLIIELPLISWLLNYL